MLFTLAMSFKAKDLSYDAKEPAFLRRLRGEVAGVDPDRHERAVARPRRAKQDGEDDGPTYVMEESNDTLSRKEYEALVSGKATSENAKPGDALPATKDEAAAAAERAVASKAKHEVEVGGLQKKRKAARIVGDDDEDVDKEKSTVKPKSKKSKKKKGIKLDFGDD